MSFDREKEILVTNRQNGVTGYKVENISLQGGSITRTFNPQETKAVPFKELEALSSTPGGKKILDEYLIVKDSEALQQLNMQVEPEYNYDENTVRNLLKTGTLEELEDCLNFAPAGVIDLIKKVAVEDELADLNKRELITAKTGFNISNNIDINHIMNENNNNEVKEQKTRKSKTVFGEQLQEQESAVEVIVEEKPKRKAGRPKKVVEETPTTEGELFKETF